MVSPNSDAAESIEIAKAKLARIKQDPARALFSDFKGVSPSGSVTVQVDMMGRLKRIHFAPHTLREGDELWLEKEINSAYVQAQKAANFLDFSVADLAAELDQAPSLKRKVAEQSAPPQREREDLRSDEDYFNNPLG